MSAKTATTAKARKRKGMFAFWGIETALAVIAIFFLHTTVMLSTMTSTTEEAGGVMPELISFVRKAEGFSNDGEASGGSALNMLLHGGRTTLLRNNATRTRENAVDTISSDQGDDALQDAMSMEEATETVLRNPLLQPSPHSQKLPLERDVEYLGVLLDGGRHYFPLDWIYNLIDYLELLNFNLLHFRLTDDQAFNVRLDSRPELAQPATPGGPVYTPTELRALVAYAKSKNIVIMPEINVPGHAGGFAGSIPNLVVPCVGFICNTGYGLPLNVSHPDLLPLLKDVFGEIKDIFSTTPFFHLGGDELETSRECFDEMGIGILDYNKFEEDLGNMLLHDLGIQHESIVRWEMTGQGDSMGPVKTRIKGVDHFWLSRDYQNEKEAKVPVFCSEGLYFDKDGFNDAPDVYEATRSMLTASRKPTAIIAATFELDVKFWFDRKVVPRLLVVAMGASKRSISAKDDIEDFAENYQPYCRMLDLPKGMCDNLAMHNSQWRQFKKEWKAVTNSWKENLCDRLAIREQAPWSMKCSSSPMVAQQNASLEVLRSNAFEEEIENNLVHSNKTRKRRLIFDKISNHKIQYTGIILDLVQGDGYYVGRNLNEILNFVDFLSKIGFNLLQVRIMSDFGFALQVDKKFELSTFDSKHYFSAQHIANLVDFASNRGIQVVPELSVAHRAGGWINAAPLAPCPRLFCEGGGSFALNTTSHEIFPTLTAVLRKLRKAFHSSPFVHLGYDERNESLGCMEEAGIEPDFDQFERNIEQLLKTENISLNEVIRWENEEQVNYKTRAGSMTHFRLGLPSSRDKDPFISTGLRMDDASSELVTTWDIYSYVQNMTKYKPLGILAPVNVFRAGTLVALNIYQRLLAMAIGLSVDGLDESDFQKTFQELCQALGDKRCSLLGSISASETAAELVLQASVTARKQVCDREVLNVTMARPREGILVEKGSQQAVAVGLKNENYTDMRGKICPRRESSSNS